MKTILILTTLALVSCTITRAPDGSKSATLDGPTALRAIEIIATK